MTTTAEQFTVGQRLTSTAQVRQLPLGTVIHSQEGGRETKIAAVRWAEENGETRDGDGIDPAIFNYTIVELPAEQFTVGQVLTSRAQVVALPVGTVINSEDRGTGRETKQADGTFTGGHLGTRPVASVDPGSYRYEIVFLPEPEPHLRADLPPIGTPITSHDVLRSLPVGTRFNTGDVSEPRWSIGQNDEGEHVLDVGGYQQSLTNIRMDGYLVIHSYPADFTIETVPHVDVCVPNSRVEPDDTLPEATFTAYLQKFRTVMYGYVHMASERVSAVDRAMEILQVEQQPPAPGDWVHNYDPAFNDLPTGSVLSKGDPRDRATHAVAGVQDGGGITVLLGHGYSNGLYRIDSIPGVPRPSTRQPTPLDRDMINEFKRRAWTVGLRAKVDNSWCPQYERAMSEVGIDHDCAMVGDWLTPDQVSAHPEGTVLRYADAARSVLFRRDNTSTNPARTRRIGGTTPGDWAESMFAVAMPGEEFRLPIHSTAEMEGMPDGTRIDYIAGGHDGTQWYTLNAGRWHLGGSGASTASRSVNHLFYVYTVLP